MRQGVPSSDSCLPLHWHLCRAHNADDCLRPCPFSPSEVVRQETQSLCDVAQPPDHALPWPLSRISCIDGWLCLVASSSEYGDHRQHRPWSGGDGHLAIRSPLHCLTEARGALYLVEGVHAKCGGRHNHPERTPSRHNPSLSWRLPSLEHCLRVCHHPAFLRPSDTSCQFQQPRAADRSQ